MQAKSTAHGCSRYVLVLDKWRWVARTLRKWEAVSLSLPHRATRLKRRIIGKVTGKGDLAFTPEILPNLEILRAILVFPRKRAILFVDGYDGSWPRGGKWEGPSARVSQSAEMVIRDVLCCKPMRSETGLPTSGGTADYLYAEPFEGSAPQAGCVSAIFCAPDGPGYIFQFRKQRTHCHKFAIR